jgi:hypothetical protein
MLPTWTGRATSINMYLAWEPTSEPQRKKRTRRGFDLCKYLAGKSCFFFQRALPRPRRFFLEARSRHTTAMDGFIWRSPSPPPRSTLGENACNRTAYQSKARWSGHAAARASISAIPTVTLWSLPRLDCGRSTDEERELRLWCLGGGSGVAGYTVRCADEVARANTPTRSFLGSNVCFGSLADLTSLARNVRFILESRHARRWHQCQLSAQCGLRQQVMASFGSLIRPGSFRESKARDVSKKIPGTAMAWATEKNVTHLSILEPLIRRHSRARIDPAPN